MQANLNAPDSYLGAHLAIDAQAVGALRGELAKDPAGTRRAVAQQFEKLFLDMVLKSMREATPKFDSLESPTVATFQSMYDEQLTQTLSSGKGIGLADLIESQIAHASHPASYKVPVRAPLSYTFAPEPASAPTQEDLSATPAAPEGQFLATIGTAAESAALTLGVSPSLVVAHAALESGWGRRPILDAKGRNTHNLFGIKAGDDWDGDKADVLTTEFVGGVAQKRIETFRSYDSYAAAFADYAHVLKRRFGSALGAGSSAQSFAAGLQRGGYATDPNYAKKLIKISESPALRSFHAG